MFALKLVFLYAVIFSCAILEALTEEEVTSLDSVLESKGGKRELLRRSYIEYFQKTWDLISAVEVVANSFTDPTGEELKEAVDEYEADLEGLLELLKKMQKVPELQNYIGALATLQENMEGSLRMLNYAMWKSKRRKRLRGLLDVLGNAVEKTIDLVAGSFKAVTDIASALTSRAIQSGVDFMEGVAAASKTIIYGVKKKQYQDGEEEGEEEKEENEEEKEKENTLERSSRRNKRKQGGSFGSLFGNKNKYKRGWMEDDNESYYQVDY